MRFSLAKGGGIFGERMLNLSGSVDRKSELQTSACLNEPILQTRLEVKNETGAMFLVFVFFLMYARTALPPSDEKNRLNRKEGKLKK